MDPLYSTGGAGCGKSYSLNTVARYLHEDLKKPNLMKVCAPTGSAALSVGGETIHGLLHVPIRFTYVANIHISYERITPQYFLFIGGAILHPNCKAMNLPPCNVTSWTPNCWSLMKKAWLAPLPCTKLTKGSERPSQRMQIWLLEVSQ